MRMHLKTALCALLLFVMCFPLAAQRRVNGVVSSAADGSPMEFVNVGVVGLARPVGTTTDRRGRYELVLPDVDSLTLRYSFTGFEPVQQTVRFSSAETAATRRLDVVMRPTSTNLKVVTVTDDATRTTTFTQIGIEKLGDAVGPNDGVEALVKTLPGVASNNEMSSQYSVRGGSFDENLVYINGVEVFRPMLIRSGQQEGMSIINPDLVDNIQFSPGGFDAAYGDKMSSALDIAYVRPTEFKARLAASFLGASASVQGTAGRRLSYALAFRHHSNQYLFGTLDTKGAYHTAYSDLQGLLHYRASSTLDLSVLALWTRNRYGLVPESQTTTFGSFMESLELDVYFDGEEVDRYNTLLGAFTLDWHPSSDFQLSWITSAQDNSEGENYDIQSQYWLYELGLGSDASVNRFDRGVGTFLEHARNRLDTRIFNTEVCGLHIVPLGNWRWGAKMQYEQVCDRMREWKWVDSAGYAMPAAHAVPGIGDTVPHTPLLQAFCNADNEVATFRATAFLQRELNVLTRHQHELSFRFGVRGQYYQMRLPDINDGFFLSPRLSASYKPQWSHDMLFRLSAGVYRQPPLYREARYADGSLNAAIAPQTSYQAAATFDYNFKWGDKPFKLTADLYYKYLTDLIPYTIDNLRVRYDAENSAVGYATGVGLRLNGEFVEGLESWASLSWMKTQEDILGDGLGWIDRPTDQRLSFKLFFQDYVPQLPWWRMSLNFVFGTGMPVTFPNQRDRSVSHRLPGYFRVDWGNTVQLSRFERLRHSWLFRHIDDVWVGVEVFNLFNHRNVVSFIWVSDYDNSYYAVPNYLTARQINLKLTIVF